MRKVKNNISVSNPAAMFAQGIESLIGDPLHKPSQYDYDEARIIQRRANKQESRGNPFNVLMRQFANL